tara:strand:+ start:2797 stop:3318 length:522 start_codon:yes stop_codon:yes gene_type:complete
MKLKQTKLIDRKIVKPVRFYQGIYDKLDTKYFINQINNNLSTNLKGKTNVKGDMTEFSFFKKDPKFQELLTATFNEKNINIPKCNVEDAWGIKMKKGDSTSFHVHNVDYSGIIYLTDSTTPIEFPDIKLKILPKKNMLLFFSGLLEHGTGTLKQGTKYAMPFNLNVIGWILNG